MSIKQFCLEQELMESYIKVIEDNDIQYLQKQKLRHQQFQLNIQAFLNKHSYETLHNFINQYEESQSHCEKQSKERNDLENEIIELDQQIKNLQNETCAEEESIRSLVQNIEHQLNLVLPNVNEIRHIGEQIIYNREMIQNPIDVNDRFGYNIVRAINILLPQNNYFRKQRMQRSRAYTTNNNELNNLVRALQEINFDDISDRFREEFNNIGSQQQNRNVTLDGLYRILRLINQSYEQFRYLRPLKEQLISIQNQIRKKREDIQEFELKYFLRQNYLQQLQKILDDRLYYLNENKDKYQSLKELLTTRQLCIKLDKAADQNIQIFQHLHDYKASKRIIQKINTNQQNQKIQILTQLQKQIYERLTQLTIFDITADEQNIILDQYNLRDIWIAYNKLYLGQQWMDKKFISNSNQKYDLVLYTNKLMIQRLLYVYMNNQELQIVDWDQVMNQIENYLISDENKLQCPIILFDAYSNYYHEDNLDENVVNLLMLIINTIENVCDISDLIQQYVKIVQLYPNKLELFTYILNDFQQQFYKNQSKQEIRKLQLKQIFNEKESFLNVIVLSLQQMFKIDIDIQFLENLIILYGIPRYILDKYQQAEKSLTSHIYQQETNHKQYKQFDIFARYLHFLLQMEDHQINNTKKQKQKTDIIKEQILSTQSQIEQLTDVINQLKIQMEQLNNKAYTYQKFKFNKLQLSQIIIFSRPGRSLFQLIEVFFQLLGFSGSWEVYKQLIQSRKLIVKLDQFNLDDLNYSSIYRVEQILYELQFKIKRHPMYVNIILWLIHQVKQFYLKIQHDDQQKQYQLFTRLIAEQEKEIKILKQKLESLKLQLQDQTYITVQQQELTNFIEYIKKSKFDYQNWLQFYENFQQYLNLVCNNKLTLQFLSLYNIKEFSISEDYYKTYLKFKCIYDEFANELIITKIVQDQANIILGEQTEIMLQKYKQYKTLRAQMLHFWDFHDLTESSVAIQQALERGYLIQQIETNF